MTRFFISAVSFTLLYIPVALSEAPVAVLNAMQIQIDDIALDLTGEAAKADAPAVEADAAGEAAPAPVDVTVDSLLQPVAAQAQEALAEPAPAAVEAAAGTFAEDAPVPDAVAAEELPAAGRRVLVAEPVAAERELAAEAPGVAAEPDPLAIAISEMEALERVRREAQDKHGYSALEDAGAAMQRGSYEEAIRFYQEASDYISERSSNASAIKEAESGMREAYYRQAQLLQKRDNLEEAYKAAIAARRAGHPKGEELALELDRLIKNPPPPPAPRVEKRWKQPAYLKNVEETDKHMKRAREYYATGEYDRCREELEIIMRDNPFNTQAITMLQKLGNKRYDVAEQEFEATRREMIHEVKSVWTPRNYTTGFTDIGGSAGITQGTNTTTTEVVMIQEKMQKIVIPEINFRQANITDVITFLGDASREYDDSNVPSDQRGVNFILSLQQPTGRAAAPDPADPFAAPLDPLGGVGGAPASAPITFQARYVTLFDALGIVMNLADLKYRIRGNVVIVMPSNFPDSELIHRMYNVLPTLVDRMVTFREDTGASGSTGDPFGMATAQIDKQSDWKKFFQELGVSWPEGSSIQHMPTIGKLVVKNTSENLSTLETVLAVLNVTPRQVEIEARFVEVLQSDLESMGFEWILNDNWEMLEHKKDAALPLESRRRVIMNKGSFTPGFGYMNKHGVGDDSEQVFDNVMRVSSVLTNPELSMVLHMLSQRKNTDLLSAPKVVTKNGSEATIKVVTEYIYPTEYDTEGATFSDEGELQTPPVTTPASFETREVGVILTVVPEVTPDGQMINLTMAPRVVSEPTWRNYGSTYVDAGGNLQYMNMEQPFFPVRSISTSIQIYNGATVVMGGMITEARQTLEDKTPFLGDLPLLGQLFRYKYESSEKRNLLIFVTAKLVDPAGRTVRDQQDIPLLPVAGMTP